MQFWSVEWLNENSQRTYPFAEHASRRDVTDTITVPDSFLVELYWPVASVFGLQSEKFFIKNLTILGSGYTLDLGYDDGSTDPPIVATTSISALNAGENQRYALVGVNDFDDSVGKVVIGRLVEINALPPGVYTFTPAGGALDPDCIRPILRGVSCLITEQNGQRSPKLRERVVFSAGNNMRLTVSQVTGEPAVIRFDAVPDPGFAALCECTETEPPCIRTINDIPGDVHQNFTLLGDNCIKLEPITNGLQIVDQCCAPCCGDAELQEVLRALRGLRNSASTIHNFQQNLNAALTQLQLNLALSGLSGCDC
jgi:hypothetical protein